MKAALFTKHVITVQEKATIEEKIGEDKMDHLIANIIQPSLQGNFSKKYKGFLEAMEDSDDVFLGSTAEMLGKLISICKRIGCFHKALITVKYS